MKARSIKTIGIVLLLVALVACSNSEDQAHSRYTHLQQEEQKLEPAEQVEKYQQLIAEFPETESAALAQQRIEQIRAEQSLSKESIQKSISSLPRIVTGYKSVYRRWPQSAADFDNGEYFFDTGYMAETIPQGLTVYLALLDTAPGYRLWTEQSLTGDAFRLDDDGESVIEIPPTQLTTEVHSRFRTEMQKGSLIFLLPK